MRNQKKLIVQQLDEKLRPFKGSEKVYLPVKGWIHTIRNSFGMTLEQLGKKIGITRQGVHYIEESEAAGSISIKTMLEVGNAMDLKFVYGFVPKDSSFQQLIDKKAATLARKIVQRTHQNMILEGQENNDKQIQLAIKELTEELKREMPKALWD
ncbi:MAG: mobile mystery protein A [Crocinitomicaceae bacterium]